jgi:hypothetical protein
MHGLPAAYHGTAILSNIAPTTFSGVFSSASAS